MILKPIKEILAMTQDMKTKMLAPIRARKIKAQAELKSAELEAKLVNLETEIHEMCAKDDLDLDLLLDKQDKSAILERRIKQYSKTLLELFPE